MNHFSSVFGARSRGQRKGTEQAESGKMESTLLVSYRVTATGDYRIDPSVMLSLFPVPEDLLFLLLML